MKPVGIVRTTRTEGPGYFATFLEHKAVPTTLLAMDEGASVPKDARSFSGLVFMGGYMGVLAKGERCISTTNRNFRGRMGHREAEIILCGPQTAAASAVAGKVASPRDMA